MVNHLHTLLFLGSLFGPYTPGFTGIDDPYEEPEDAEIVMQVATEDGVLAPPEKMAAAIIEILEQKGFLHA